MGHVNFETLNSMIKKELVQGAPKKSLKKKICSLCFLGKQKRLSFPQATVYRATKKFELIHGDLCGPINPSTSAGNRHIFVLIDDYSRYMWTILMKEKREAFKKFNSFKAMVEKELESRIQTFRTYRGGEFVSLEFIFFLPRLGNQKTSHRSVYTSTKRSCREKKHNVIRDGEEYLEAYAHV
ncbi:unnamed protein product [Microthlaspi erraticum]|uniref:Integrase catalytic domain-containing protein n=1 Tax=Microthlaspi erraticum TaxID=1685480 RepID=A0A6D2I8J8_9BRAS|nr:unnamed protein product [Microthlaspi erraticum]CAA7053738.1 unnamed protein product [Microthlaspi erraticum]